MVLTGKPFVFCAGADVKEFPNATAELAREGSRAGHELFGRIRALPYPTVAAINGACLGGGVEIALHCSHRTISAAVRHFACPEVFLGIFPAWGGTQLIPRLVGAANAVKFVVANPMRQNRMLDGRTAQRDGLRRPAARARRVPGRVDRVRTRAGRRADEPRRARSLGRTRTSCAAPAARSVLDARRNPRPARRARPDRGRVLGLVARGGLPARGGRGRGAPAGPARAGLALRLRPRRAAREADAGARRRAAPDPEGRDRRRGPDGDPARDAVRAPPGGAGRHARPRAGARRARRRRRARGDRRERPLRRGQGALPRLARLGLDRVGRVPRLRPRARGRVRADGREEGGLRRARAGRPGRSACSRRTRPRCR